MKLNAKKCATDVFHKATLSYPLLRIDQQVLKTVRSHKVRESGGAGGGVSQEIGAVDLAAICVAVYTFRPRVQCSVA